MRNGLRWLRTRTGAVRVALVVLAVYAGVGVLGGWLAPYSPTAFDIKTVLKPPSWQHPFGTDGFGRDVLSRILAGTGTILVLSLGATAFGVGLGAAVGLASGY